MSSKQRRVVVYGSSGCLGRQVAETLEGRGMSVVGFDRRNFSIDETAPVLTEKLKQTSPDAVINCVARTGLAACADDVEGAFQVNTVFAQRLCAATKLLGVDYYQFGTEYAFACNTEGKIYGEADANAPSTIYGLTKYLGEPPKSDPSCYTLRLPLLYGPTHAGQIVGALLAKLRNGETVRAADDVFSTPVCSIDVANFLGDAIGSDTKLPGLVHLASKPLLSLFETVHAFAEYHKCADNLQPAKSSDFVPDGSKPRFGGLESSCVAALPSIEDNLDTL